jgi:F-box protein 11
VTDLAQGQPTLLVGPDGLADHRKIADAIYAAAPGTQILVRPGTYNEALVIDKPVDLLADGPAGTVIIESQVGSCVEVRTDHATVRGFTLRSSGPGPRDQRFAVDMGRGSLVIEDCDITCAAGSCIMVHGPGTATIRRCRIHDSAGAGIVVHDQGRGTVEDCEIWGNTLSGVEIGAGGDPAVRNCRIRDGQAGGVMVHGQGRGTVEGCEIWGNKLAGVEIQAGGDPTVRGCRIRDGQSSGVYVHNQGRGTVEGCEFWGNKLFGVEIKAGGDPTVRGCRIRDGQAGGVYVHDQGRGTIEDCEIWGNATVGVQINSGGDPTVRNCRIRDGQSAGVVVMENSKGTIEGCELWGNKLSGVEIGAGGDPAVRNCRIRDGQAGGVIVYDQGRGTVQDCEIWGNKLVGVEIRAGGDPTVRNCRIRDGQASGVRVHDQGRGIVEDCEIWGNAIQGVQIDSGGDPTVRNCRIRDGQSAGVLVFGKSKGTIEGCEIWGNKLSGVEIQAGGDPTVRSCRIRDGHSAGVVVMENSKGTIDGCEFWGNKLSGVEIQASGDPTIRDCRIRDGQSSGVYVHDQGRGTVQDCEIWGNKLSGVEIKAGGDPTIRDCRIRDGQASGVYVHDQGRGTIEYCEIWGNASGDVVVADGCQPALRDCTVGLGRATDVVDEDQTGAGTSEAEGAVGRLVAPEGGPYRRNAFRVSGLPVTSTAAQIRQAATRVRAGSAAVGAFRLLPLEPAPDVAQVEEALRLLRDPVQRFHEAFFWFLPPPSGAEDPALAALAAGDPGQAVILWAVSLWMRRSGNSEDDAVARHNLAVLAHAQALDHVAAGEVAPDELWEQAFTSWRPVLGDEVFWSTLTAGSQAAGDPRLKNAATRLRAELPSLLLAPSAALVASLAQAGQPDQAAHHAGLLRRSGLGSGHITHACEQAAAPVLARVRDLGQQAESRASADPAHGGQVAADLLERTGPLLAAVDALLQKGNTARDGIHDDLARRVRQCQIPYANRTEDWAGSVLQLRQARAISATAAVREDLDIQIATVERNAEAAASLAAKQALAAACWPCGEPPNTDKPVPVPIFLVVKREPGPKGQLSWKSVTVPVPACDKCRRKYEWLKSYRKPGRPFEDFPAVKELLEQGWRVGTIVRSQAGQLRVKELSGSLSSKPP